MKVKEMLKEAMVFPSSEEMAKMMYKDVVRLYTTLSDVIRHGEADEYEFEDVLADIKRIVDKYADAKVDTKQTTTRY